MKKKILAICLMLVMALAAVVVAGCSAFNDVGTISWVEKPKSVYKKDSEEELAFSFTVETTVNNVSQTITVEYPKDKGTYPITIKNFSTATTGSRNATVTYTASDGELVLSFAYSVVDGIFASGSGTESDPYIVKTAEHFQSLLDQKSYNYYKLGDNIDFSGVTLTMANLGDAFKTVEDANNGAWAGYIDGNNYSLLNLTKVVNPEGKVIAKHNELFGFVASKKQGGFTLKNITINYKATGEGAISALIGSNGPDGVIKMENVKFTGTMDAAYINNSNISPVISTLNDGKGAASSVEFTNCENSVSIFNSYAVPNVAGYFNIQAGSANQTETGWNAFAGKENVVKFTNCKFTGTIESACDGVASFVIVNDTNEKTKIGWLSMTGCSHDTATMVKTNKEPAAVVANATALATVKGNAVTGEVEKPEKGTIEIKKAEGSATNQYTLTSSKTADKYVVFALLSVTYTRGGGGNIKVRLGEFKSVTVDLMAIDFDATEEYTKNDKLTYGSTLIVKKDNKLVFYNKTLNGYCSSSKCTLIAVGYKDGTVVSVGKLGGVTGICTENDGKTE